jgi:hypothetical protein
LDVFGPPTDGINAMLRATTFLVAILPTVSSSTPDQTEHNRSLSFPGGGKPRKSGETRGAIPIGSYKNLAVVFIISNIQRIGEKLRPRIQLFQYACEVLVIIIQGDFDADHRYEDERWKKKAQKRRSKEGV